MAYKYSKGSTYQGDIYNEDDSGRNTYLDWGEDYIGLVTSGSAVLVVSGSQVGIGTDDPDYTLDVAGNAGFDEYLYHNGDDDTFIRFEDNEINIKAGNVNFINITEATQDKITFNDGGTDVDFIVQSPSGSKAIYLNSGNEVLHINHDESGFKTKIHSTHGEAITVNDNGVIFNEDAATANDLRVESDSNTHMFFVDAGSEMVGVGTSDPLVALDVHHTGASDPTGLTNDEGGGEVVFFGSSSAALVAGGIYYLNTGGGWQSADSAATGSGHKQLLGVSLGTKAADNGMLIRGYFDVNTFYSGSFIKGGPMYIQSASAARTATEGGYLSGAAPTAGDSYARVVGYGTDTANVIYFNPSPIYIEIQEEE